MPQLFCTCATCNQLDRLPVRRHGIPGARQLLLCDVERDNRVVDGQGNEYELVAMTDEEIANWKPVGPRQRGLEGLGLFDPTLAGANQPTLF